MATDRFDSLIFDMDGTLWDAVDSYCRVWNETYALMGIDYTVGRHQLLECMGLPIGEILQRISPAGLDHEQFYTNLRKVEDKIMPEIGGRLYNGIDRLIPELARSYRLFMASNCGPTGLKNFLQFTNLAPYFTDTITYGDTHRPKDYNIALLVERHSLKLPLYVGDTQGDCDSAHRAGVPMLHVTYGFGQCKDAELTAHSVEQLAETLGVSIN